VENNYFEVTVYVSRRNDKPKRNFRLCLLWTGAIILLVTDKILTSYKIMKHTADIGIIARGKDLKETFANTARGMFHLIIDLRKVQCRIKKEVDVSAGDPEILLVAWLNELIYLFDTDHVLFKKFEITELTDKRLKAFAYGEKVDCYRHTLKIGIKATTYHMLQIRQEKGIYTARVLFDI